MTATIKTYIGQEDTVIAISVTNGYAIRFDLGGKNGYSFVRSTKCWVRVCAAHDIPVGEVERLESLGCSIVEHEPESV